jgi:hypothetical protein
LEGEDSAAGGTVLHPAILDRVTILCPMPVQAADDANDDDQQRRRTAADGSSSLLSSSRRRLFPDSAGDYEYSKLFMVGFWENFWLF